MHHGLSELQARQRLSQDGPNELPVSKPRGVLSLLRDVVLEPMFLLLVTCGGIYWVLGDGHEALMLLGFVVVVMGITFVQQRRSERSLETLRDLSSPRALVLRDGQARRVAGRELVCGDVVLLAEGDRVPADLHLLAVSNLAVDESLLTGESVPVLKQAASGVIGAVETPGDSDPARVFSGTLVTRGTAQGLVVATGARSALGRIGQSLQGLGTEVGTPIQRETRHIVNQVALVGLLLACGLAWAYWYTQGDWLRGLLAGLTLAMAILPEELPVVLTLFLGLGAWRLAREQVLARSVPAIELLGATTVLCVDKTGTLTTNRMAVRRLWSEAATHDAVQNVGKPLPEDLHTTLEFAILASHRRAFDPMETAILQAGQHWLLDTEHLHHNWTLVEDYSLSAEMLAMSRVWQSPDHRALMIATKGAPEAVVDLCHLDATHRARIAAQVEALAGEGLRVLGVARATFEAPVLPGNQHDFVFEFLGLVALEDPVRPDVPQAIAECHAAGIRVVMMTGDHPVTALSVARQVGLPTDGVVMTGAELSVLNDVELAACLADVHVFCRVQPEHKLRLVQAFQAQGEVVAMTGDGVNDAPALKAAHIGVAMGARGSDVAREAAALVLLNDDFASIVTAVRYGRRVFANLRKAIAFVIAVHVPIVGLSFVPVLLGWPLLLMPVHVLFLQLIIDPACSVVFEAEPLEATAMQTEPRRPDAKLFDGEVIGRGFWQGVGLLGLLLMLYAGIHLVVPASDDIARTVTFIALVLSTMGLIYTNRSWGQVSWCQLATTNRYFGWAVLATAVLLGVVVWVPNIGRLFFFVPPSPDMLLVGGATAGAALLWFECVKWVQGRRRSRCR